VLSFTVIDIDLSCRFSLIYGDLYNTVGNADYDKDLRWWSQTHGVDMAMSWPVFEVRTIHSLSDL
jgi:hypothetical protein